MSRADLNRRLDRLVQAANEAETALRRLPEMEQKALMQENYPFNKEFGGIVNDLMKWRDAVVEKNEEQTDQ
ncbi:hypothetical protein ACFPU1_16145 [Thalassorhabdus alkalitolerans]|uniref:Uncharacterized protein n=1 Tax=Thalassorhabdus alkalitolerans TaxID=2282697 RepID=A0ABW0YUK1_9BACI|nr:hypothetical protein [Bacillus sp. FJAT-44742]